MSVLAYMYLRGLDFSAALKMSNRRPTKNSDCEEKSVTSHHPVGFDLPQSDFTSLRFLAHSASQTSSRKAFLASQKTETGTSLKRIGEKIHSLSTKIFGGKRFLLLEVVQMT